ncbi:MAG: DUF4397 domain-containing protein, partial [Thermomicrobiales bacterium]
KACLVFVHASPDAPAVDVYVYGEKVVTGLKYGSESGFRDLPAGAHHVQIAATGADPGQAVIDLPALQLVAGKASEVAAVGLLAGITALVSEVDVHAIAPSAAGLPRARVRIVHAVPGAPAVDVSVIGGDVTTRLATGLGFGAAGGYTEVTAGSHAVRVTPSGTGNVVSSLASFAFLGDTVYSVYALISPTDGSVFLLAVATSASRPSASASPEATPAG